MSDRFTVLTPTTAAGRALLRNYAPKSAGNPAGDWYSRPVVQAAIAAIEREAAAQAVRVWLTSGEPEARLTRYLDPAGERADRENAEHAKALLAALAPPTAEP